MDFISLFMPVAFNSGASDGDRACVNVTVLADAMVECEERFTLELILQTSGDSLSSGNNSTSIILADSDGMHVSVCF